jgi:hypothetical protein
VRQTIFSFDSSAVKNFGNYWCLVLRHNLNELTADRQVMQARTARASRFYNDCVRRPKVVRVLNAKPILQVMIFLQFSGMAPLSLL